MLMQEWRVKMQPDQCLWKAFTPSPFYSQRTVLFLFFIHFTFLAPDFSKLNKKIDRTSACCRSESCVFLWKPCLVSTKKFYVFSLPAALRENKLPFTLRKLQSPVHLLYCTLCPLLRLLKFHIPWRNILQLRNTQIYFWIFCNLRGECYSLACQFRGWCFQLLLHRTKLICLRIYRNMATLAKSRCKLWEKIFGPLKLVWGIKGIFLLSLSYCGMEMFILLADVCPLKIATFIKF